MCGIAGFELRTWTAPERRSAPARIQAMVAALAHRGPDARRATLLEDVAFGHARLSIVDITGGQQPMRDPDTGTCVLLNGEIFNHEELRALLPAYRFRTRSDTEVVLAAYARWGMGCVERFVGQWAIALWDPRTRSLHLSRDRFGVRPLFYAETSTGLVFASEIKALFAGGLVQRAFDARGVKESTCLWSTIPPRTAFDGIKSLPPGCNGVVDNGRVSTTRYWRLDLADDRVDGGMSMERAACLVAEKLEDAVALRLRADVPVAAYLSGGLDSSLICAIAQRQLHGAGGSLSTFSLAFAQPRYDEREFQQGVAAHLGTRHCERVVEDREIGELLPDAVSFSEQPLVRSAPAPLLALSGLVHDHDTKVVLTGEGADECFFGYQLYQEAKVRAWWAKAPNSRWRHLPLQRIYPYLALDRQNASLTRAFYAAGLDTPGHPAFSHIPRWRTTSRIWRFFSRDFADQVEDHDPLTAVLGQLPPGFATWRLLARAQHLETELLLSGYLLSAQGDRMLMGHSVEGRFPFLDHRVVELAATLPDELKLRRLEEKAVLRRVADGLTPGSVLRRPKLPYRAPVAEALMGPGGLSWAPRVLNRDAVDHVGIFDGAKSEQLFAKLRGRSLAPSEADNMALMAVASVQLLFERVIQAPLPSACARAGVTVIAPALCDAGSA